MADQYAEQARAIAYEHAGADEDSADYEAAIKAIAAALRTAAEDATRRERARGAQIARAFMDGFKRAVGLGWEYRCDTADRIAQAIEEGQLFATPPPPRPAPPDRTGHAPWCSVVMPPSECGCMEREAQQAGEWPRFRVGGGHPWEAWHGDEIEVVNESEDGRCVSVRGLASGSAFGTEDAEHFQPIDLEPLNDAARHMVKLYGWTRQESPRPATGEAVPSLADFKRAIDEAEAPLCRGITPPARTDADAIGDFQRKMATAGVSMSPPARTEDGGRCATCGAADTEESPYCSNGFHRRPYWLAERSQGGRALFRREDGQDTASAHEAKRFPARIECEAWIRSLYLPDGEYTATEHLDIPSHVTPPPEPEAARCGKHGERLLRYCPVCDFEAEKPMREKHAALVEAARAAEEVLSAITRSASERFDDAAEAFYRDTGMMAPGKSAPLEMAGEHSDEDRWARWRGWTLTRVEEERAKWREVRDEIRAALAGVES